MAAIFQLILLSSVSMFLQPEELLEQLETMDLFELQPQEKLLILSSLCDRIMNSYSVQDFMGQTLTESGELG